MSNNDERKTWQHLLNAVSRPISMPWILPGVLVALLCLLGLLSWDLSSDKDRLERRVSYLNARTDSLQMFRNAYNRQSEMIAVQDHLIQNLRRFVDQAGANLSADSSYQSITNSLQSRPQAPGSSAPVPRPPTGN